MAVNANLNETTTTTLTDQLTETINVTVRVPNGASGTLFEAASDRLARIAPITTVTITDTGGIAPRNGATHVTVTADITADVTSREELIEILANTVGVEAIESPAVT